MRIELTLRIDGKMTTFTKDDIYLSDNIRAVKHQIAQKKFYTSDDQTAEMFEEMQDDFCEMIADIFNNDFSSEQFKNGLSLANRTKAEDIYILALGGKLKDEQEDDESKK